MFDMYGYNPIAGSASPSLTSEQPAPLPYADECVPYMGETSMLIEQRQAIFTPAQFMIAGAYNNASLMPDQRGVTWDYASPFLYAHTHATPYPYVLVDK